MIFDSSSIFNLIKDNKIEILFDGKTSGLVYFELCNLLWKESYIFKKIELEEAIMILSLMLEILAEMKIQEVDLKEVLELSVKLGITSYDAVFVHLALKENETLVTDDEKLKRRVREVVRVKSSEEV
ncbi:MAG: toxin VapC [Candidatus Altiarchaeales archaeon]|nr:MAG: toxin VapC [Candidatus Altiarchaeales archaeon]